MTHAVTNCAGTKACRSRKRFRLSVLLITACTSNVQRPFGSISKQAANCCLSTVFQASPQTPLKQTHPLSSTCTPHSVPAAAPAPAAAVPAAPPPPPAAAAPFESAPVPAAVSATASFHASGVTSIPKCDTPVLMYPSKSGPVCADRMSSSIRPSAAACCC